MILTGPKIQEEVLNKNIIIDPFDPAQLNPNSYDFRLGSKLKTYKNLKLDTKSKNETETVELMESGIILYPNKLYLGHTPDFCVKTSFKNVML